MAEHEYREGLSFAEAIALFRARGITGAAFNLLLLLFEQGIAGGAIRVSQADLARKTGTHYQNVHRSLKTLLAVGVLGEAPRQGMHRCYALNPAYDWPECDGHTITPAHMATVAHERRQAAQRFVEEQRQRTINKRAELVQAIADLERRQQTILARADPFARSFRAVSLAMNQSEIEHLRSVLHRLDTLPST